MSLPREDTESENMKIKKASNPLGQGETPSRTGMFTGLLQCHPSLPIPGLRGWHGPVGGCASSQQPCHLGGVTQPLVKCHRPRDSYKHDNICFTKELVSLCLLKSGEYGERNNFGSEALLSPRLKMPERSAGAGTEGLCLTAHERPCVPGNEGQDSRKWPQGAPGEV